MSTACRVLLVDDHTLVRSGLRMVLSAAPGIEVVGEACDGAEGVAMALDIMPDVVLMDVAMPGMSGLQAAEQLHKKAPDIRIIMLTMHDAEEYVSRALHAGVSGYLLKDAAPEEAHVAIQAVMEGGIYLSPGVSRQVVAHYVGQGSGRQAGTLTPRQEEILKMLALGRSAKEIAYDLNLSVKTVETHRSQIMERLGIRDLPSLVRYAIRVGLVSADA